MGAWAPIVAYYMLLAVAINMIPPQTTTTVGRGGILAGRVTPAVTVPTMRHHLVRVTGGRVPIAA